MTENRMSLEEFRKYKAEQTRNQARKNKYSAVRQTYGGYSYASKMEARFARDLDLRLKAKDIKSWERQPQIELRGENGSLIATYKLDFLINHHDGSIEYVEVKGFRTRDWRLKWKLAEDKFKYQKNIILTLVENC